MKFGYDWFSHNIPRWERYLGHLQGKAHIKALEIGCFEGRATVWLLQNILTRKTASITVIDTFRGSIENIDHHDNVRNLLKKFKNNISPWKSKVTILKGYSYQYLRKFAPLGVFNFVYVDGSHMAKDVLEDAILAWRLLKVGGIMTFDDYRDWNYYKDEILCPKLAIDSFLAIYKNQYEIIDSDYQIAIKKLGDSIVLDRSRPHPVR
jgi:predicted O-methyltransferase YrrM